MNISMETKQNQGECGSHRAARSRFFRERDRATQELIRMETELRRRRGEIQYEENALRRIEVALRNLAQEGVTCAVGRTPKDCIPAAIRLANEEAIHKQTLNKLSRQFNIQTERHRNLTNKIGRISDDIRRVEGTIRRNRC